MSGFRDSIYVAYSDVTNDRKATVRTYSSSENKWIDVGQPAGISSGRASYTSLSISPYNILFVAFIDFAHDHKATVMKFNATYGYWETVGTPGFSSIADRIVLSVDEHTPYVAYLDTSMGSKITVKKFNGTQWETVGNPAFAGGIDDFPSLFVDRGIPYVAYVDPVSKKAAVMKFFANSWTNVGSIGFSEGEALYPSLYVNQGVPYVSFLDLAHSNKVTVMKYAR